MVDPGPPRPVEQRGRQPGGRPDLGTRRAQHPLRLDHSFSPSFKGMFSGYYNNRPSVRNCGGAQGCDRGERSPGRFRFEHGLHRRGLHPAHLHDARPHPVGLDHQQQPDEPLHRGLGPLVHGRRQPLVGRELAGADVGLPAVRAASSSGTRARRRSTSPATSPTTPWASPGRASGIEKNDRWQFSTDLAWVRGRSTFKVGPRVPASQVPAQGLGGRAARPATSTSTGSAPAATTPRATTSARPAIPSRRSSSGRCTTPTRTSTPSPPGTRTTSRRGSTPSSRSTASSRCRPACAWTTRPRAPRQNDEYSTFDANTPNPGAGGRPGAVIFAGDGPGPRGHADVREPAAGIRGDRGSGFAYRTQRQDHLPRRVRDVLRGRGVLPVHR